jgi:hypothetical protein
VGSGEQVADRDAKDPLDVTTDDRAHLPLARPPRAAQQFLFTLDVPAAPASSCGRQAQR